MTIDLTPVFQAIIALLAALITYKLIPWIKAKTTKQQQDNLALAARIAVYAAEQIFGSGKAEEKLEYALAALRRIGYNVDTQLVRESIEEAVNTMTLARSYQAEAITPDQAENEQTHPPEETETAE